MPQAFKPKRKTWPGVLGKPIVRCSKDLAAACCGKGASPSDIEIWIEAMAEEQRINKIRPLLEHYGLRPGANWRDLAMALANDCVDGFRVVEHAPKTVGRPKRWSGTAGKQFVAEVKALVEAEGIKVSEAIDLLSSLDPERYRPGSRDSLRKRFDEARKGKRVRSATV